MPFKPVENPKCPKCQKSVYAAEEKIAGGHKWHKGCFKCSMCNKLLDSTTCADHDGSLYCKSCHGRKFGPKGYGFSGGAGGLSMDTGEQFGNTEFVSNGHSKPQSNGLEAPAGQGCPRCQCFVYHADQIFSKNQVWHKQCFKCRTCHRSLDSRTACDGPDKEIYCNECFRSLNIGLDCVNCKGICWENRHRHKQLDDIRDLANLRKIYQKKTLVPQITKPKSAITMESADKGVGALYIIMDSIRRKQREAREEEEKQKQEEAFHNAINKGRGMLKPLSN